MLVAAHLAEVLALLLLPAWIGARLASRWDLPKGLLGVGALGFVIAEVLILGMAPLVRQAFEAGILPMPERDQLPLVEAMVVAAATALAYEAARVWVFVRYVDEHKTARAAALVGLGFGMSAAAMMALVVLGVSTMALVGEGTTMDELESLGVSGRAAVKIGLRIYAWWEGSPLDALRAGLQELLLVLAQVGFGVFVGGLVASKRYAWVLVAGLIHAGMRLMLWWGGTEGAGLEFGAHVLVCLAGTGLVYLGAEQWPSAAQESKSD